jgi:hypothetical protein
MPPLDNAQVSDKGFIGQTSLDIGYRLSKFVSVGLHIPLQFGYLFKSADADVANDLGNHYGTFQAAGLLTLRACVGL